MHVRLCGDRKFVEHIDIWADTEWSSCRNRMSDGGGLLPVGCYEIEPLYDNTARSEQRALAPVRSRLQMLEVVNLLANYNCLSAPQAPREGIG